MQMKVTKTRILKPLISKFFLIISISENIYIIKEHGWPDYIITALRYCKQDKVNTDI